MFFKCKTQKCAYDMLVVGLGNPGAEYQNTRHNVGFMAADALCEKFGATLQKPKHKALICECKIGNKRILIAKPTTYMNLSGQAVAEIVKFYKIPTDKILVMFDDISLDVGNIRIRRNGTHGGHNGMKNILEQLSTNDIMRIKIGVGKKPHPDYDLKDWVLGKFQKTDVEAVNTAVSKAVLSVEEIVTGSIDKAMNKYNS